MSDVTAPVGTTWELPSFTVTAANAAAYADATNDPNPRYRGDDPVAPPMVHVLSAVGGLLQMVTDPGVKADLARLVHGEHDVTFHRVLRPGDRFDLTGELVSVDDKPSGLVLGFGLRGTVQGELALEGTTSVFIRKPRDPNAPRKPKPAPPTIPAADWTIHQPTTPDQAARYAEASGDRNPIHLDEAFARAVGLPGVILHGLCTMAFAARDLTDHFAGGDPARLERLAVRWSRPVLPGSTLKLLVWGEADDDGAAELTFETHGPDGKAVVVDGRARIRAV